MRMNECKKSVLVAEGSTGSSKDTSQPMENGRDAWNHYESVQIHADVNDTTLDIYTHSWKGGLLKIRPGYNQRSSSNDKKSAGDMIAPVLTQHR